MEHLYEKLIAYSASDAYPFHMPGHKRNGAVTGASLPYELDITEIDGFDDLHHADGILRDAEQEAARVFGAGETRFLVNGSTVGLLSAVLGCTSPGGRILMARNCHKSVYHAVELGDLRAEYLYPPYDEDTKLNMGIRPEDVEAHLAADAARTGGARGHIQAVVITSPTYDGVVSDVRRIAEIVHRYGIPLIVDAAHGAHFGFHPYFPPHANALGADIVVCSVHKTLPSLTQTALLHMNGKLADRRRIDHFLDMLQSSSPSYVLLSSIDECVRVLAEEGESLFAAYVRRLKALRERLGALKNMRLLETESFDPSKLVISVKGLAWRKPTMAGAVPRRVTGPELYQVLREEFHLQPEMAAGSYVIAMTSIADTEEGFDRLSDALFALDERMCPAEETSAEPCGQAEISAEPCGQADAKKENSGGMQLIPAEQVYTAREAQEIAAQLAWNRKVQESGQTETKTDPEQSEAETGLPEDEISNPKDEISNPEDETGNPEDETGNPEDETGRPKNEAGGREEKTGELRMQSIPWPETAGCIALEYAYLYPPGIPLAVPGERMGEELTSAIQKYEAGGLEIKGTCQKGQINVLKDGEDLSV